MEVPFNQEQFLQVFRAYNLAVWPFQIFLIVIALLAIFLTLRKVKYSDRIIVSILSFLWFWMAVAYHFAFFLNINPLAIIFAAVFLFQGFLLFFFGIAREELHFKYVNNLNGLAAIILFLYALIFYPLLGYALGHYYPSTPTFGLPCPTTIFTFGLLLLLEGKINKVLYIIPVVWALIGFTAALKLGILQDIGLLVSAILTITVSLMNQGVTKKM
jgi:hypothetical protein